MFVPLNLRLEEIEQLRSSSTIPQDRYCLETIIPLGKAPEITYVSPAGSASLSDECRNILENGFELEELRYFEHSQFRNESLLQQLLEVIVSCGYKAIISILSFTQKLAASPTHDTEWRFIEKVVAFCIYIKSPEVTFYIDQILRKILAVRNIVLYISDSQDAHFTMHLDPMDRECIFIAIDLLVALCSSPQGYPIPAENVFMLFELTTYIWYRKPTGLLRGNMPLEKLTRQDILEFVDALRVKYVDKLFPQYSTDDQKMVYFEVIAEVLNEVKVCDSQFENSTHLWENGDFIKPLSTQATRRRDWSIDQAFSPFVYDGECSTWISTMPPIIRQKNIYKEYEIRGTYFLDSVSCVKIDTKKLTGKKAGIDWRYSGGLQENMCKINLPPMIAHDLINCFKKLSLCFCTFDLIFDGENYYLLDINYNGQWIFSDIKCDMEITRRMLNHLGNRSASNHPETLSQL
jgi:hypothetical protein